MREVEALGKRAGGVGELVMPGKRADVAGMSDAQIAQWLADRPANFRRPIIATGKTILLGFTKAVRDALSA